MATAIEGQVEIFQQRFDRIFSAVSSAIVGHEDAIMGVLTSLLVGGHCLLEGVPGLGKTRLVRRLAECIDADFSRIQFTPDLMPADILGTTIVVDSAAGKRFEFRPGPIFGNVVLADEINRGTPKTQSALLEAMEEHTVTIANTTHKLQEPFFVVATQNPIEMEGTYPLPEAQLDRFVFKILMMPSDLKEMIRILDLTTGQNNSGDIERIDKKHIMEMRQLVRFVPAAEPVKEYAAKLVLATNPESPHATPGVKRYVKYGSSPRGAQALVFAAKVQALVKGRFNASREDIANILLPALRHRVILRFEAEAEGIGPDQILSELVSKVK